MQLPGRVGVFVDASNIYQNGGARMRYDVLRHYAQTFGTVQRLNAYLTADTERADEDREYREKTEGFAQVLRSLGYHTDIKPVKWYTDPDSDRRYGKANVDVDLAVDLLVQASNLDHVILVTGDGDFVRAVQHVRDRGCRVEVIGFDHVSADLRREVDVFTSGYLIPELLPTNARSQKWGSVGSTVRGFCYYHHPDESYGFLAFLTQLSAMSWISDPRMPDSPYAGAFFHDSNLPPGVNPGRLPNRQQIFEFIVAKGERGIAAEDLRLVGLRDERRERDAAWRGSQPTAPGTGLEWGDE